MKLGMILGVLLMLKLLLLPIDSSSYYHPSCYNSSKTVSHVAAELPQTPQGVCIEKIGNSSYIALAPHPDDSTRIFLASHRGKIWLATVPKEGSRSPMKIRDSNPFLDISDQVINDDAFGLIGMAFHPNFAHNGRFFVSYYCDKLQHQNCIGRCSCNSEVNCDPAKVGADRGVEPCQFHAVIAEYTTNSTSQKNSLAKVANPSEVRRIFTFGIPSRGVHGGQILIGLQDGHLYFLVGDNGRIDARASFSQNKGSILGKILRIDIDHIPSAKEIHEKGLWGNYSVPVDNPYTDDNELAPEIWALGFRLPWGCSFDSERPSYLLCADAGQNRYEEVSLVTRGGNYGWPFYEGPFLFQPKNTFNRSLRLTLPIMGYNHSENKGGSSSITGGYIYRSFTDPCLYGRYMFMDLYAGTMWLGTETPENSRNFTTSKNSVTCAQDTPLKCGTVAGDGTLELGYVLSLGEDNRKDIYILSTNGLYRIVRPSRCNYQCSKESLTTSKQTSSSADILIQQYFSVFINVLVLVHIAL
ncbi:hypothetical protein Leryth_017655 [Lithospermum erythrorhizon]|nr:hypothetical protein Leryth_017655 [Lithospermum erythrorhizon]